MRRSACRYNEFECRRKHGRLSLVNDECGAGTEFGEQPIPRPGENYRMYVTECNQVQHIPLPANE